MFRKLILVFVCFVPALVSAQNKPEDVPSDRQIKGVIIAGMNLSQVDGDEVYGFYKPGANVGVGALVPLGKNFYFGLETLFNQKGAYKKSPPAGDSTGKPYYRLRMDYLDVPALVYYEDRHIFTVGLGFSWGRRVNYKETIRGIDTTYSRFVLNGAPVWTWAPGSDTIQYPLSKNDWDVIVSVQLRLWHHLKMELRYTYSIFPLGTRDYVNSSGLTWTRKLYNNMLSVRLLYLLNEKYAPPPKSGKNKKNKSMSKTPAWKS